MQATNITLIRRWRRVSLGLAVAAILLAGLGLAGWIFDSYALRSGFHAGGTIKVNTALCLIMAGFAIIGLQTDKIRVSRLLPVVMLVIAVITLLQYSFHQDWGIDQLFFTDSDTNPRQEAPGRMSILTAFNLAFLAIALLSISFRKYNVGQFLAAFIFILAYASLLGHLFDISSYYHLGRFSAIAGHTALVFIFLNISLLLYKPGRGWMQLLFSLNQGGQLARFTFGYFLVVAPVFVGAYLFSLDRWQLSPGFAIISLFLLTCLITLPISYFYLHRLNKLDIALQKANSDLAGHNSALTHALHQVKSANSELEVMADEVNAKSRSLEKRNQELSDINQGLDDILYMASHDLKTPINNLETILKELHDLAPAYLAPEDQELVTLAENSVKSLKRTIEDLAKVIRSQQQGGHAPEIIPLADLLTEVQVELAREISGNQARILLELSVTEVLFPRVLLRSILFNLVLNALKYRSPERAPEIKITAATVPNWVKINVADNGLGLTEDQQSKIFTLFKRFHRHVEGSGIGLYIVKRTLENHGGLIRVSSQPGEGTTFTLFLPQ